VKRCTKLFIFIFATSIINPLSGYSNDLKDAEDAYIDHRVNFFDFDQITDTFLCSIAIQKSSAEWEESDASIPYKQEAIRRGINKEQCINLTGRSFK
jgi:hypothetical protein